MNLWIILTILACLASVLIAIPLIRRFERPQSQSDHALQIGRDQMAELERDIERDLIGKDEAASAKAEIERRILTAAKAETSELSGASTRSRGLALAGVVALIAGGSAVLYSFVGRPDLPAKPFAGTAGGVTNMTASALQQPSSEPTAGSVEELIAGLVTRLENDPSDAEGWRMLGWSYFNTESYSLAADAYERSVELEATDPDVLSAYGETLVRAGDGLVSEKAIGAFDAALVINPVDPRARFFKGMALEQAGDPTAAIDLWLEILATAPTNVEWLGGLRTRIQELANTTGYDLGDRLGTVSSSGGLGAPSATEDKGPSQADIAAAQDMTPQDRQAMIVGMVDQLAARLEENPNDPAGWAKLIRSRQVLGDNDGAIAAYLTANELFKDSPEDQAELADAARELGVSAE